MSVEIERKWVPVDASKIPFHEAKAAFFIYQMYLINTKWLTVRIREKQEVLVDTPMVSTSPFRKQSILTIKGKSSNDGLSRREYEFGVFRLLSKFLCKVFKRESVSKLRYVIPTLNGLAFEVDKFTGRHKGLVITELEVPDESTVVPDVNWLGYEVTGDERLYNAYLAAASDVELSALICELEEKKLQLQKT